MDDQEFAEWLQKQDFRQKSTKAFDVKVPDMTIKSARNCSKSETLILPLSLENNATTTGTAAIVEQFGKEFGIPCEHAKEYLPFDQKNKTFDIEAARRHQEFLASLSNHKKDMAETVRQLTEAEKGFEMQSLEVDSSLSADDLQSGNNIQKENAKFQKVFDSLVKQMWEAQQSSDLAEYSNFISRLVSQRENWAHTRDHHGRTVLHKAVEDGNLLLVKTLLCAGADVNVKEKCGATPLLLAVIKKNEELSAYLLENFAAFDSHFFSTIPSPHVVAKSLNLEVAKIMDQKSKESKSLDSSIWKIFQDGEISNGTAPESNSDLDSIVDEAYQFNRKNKSCKTLFVGDQGTNKVLRGVKNRSEAAYGWCAEVPGDMHAKGYLYEVCMKVMKPGGLMHILCNVISRTKINDDSFGQKKFQEQNLNRIEEAVRDMGVSFGMAAVLEFRDSSSFPSLEELSRCKRETGAHSLVMLTKFKEWISSSSEEDVAFKYYAQMFTLFGPLQQMYSHSIRFGHGLGREASWMLMHPLFAQSNKRNYHTEAMVHIVNFVAAWPLALRELLRKNCSISLNGKDGHNLALDEWVESCVVQPMKNYATGLLKLFFCLN